MAIEPKTKISASGQTPFTTAVSRAMTSLRMARSAGVGDMKRQKSLISSCNLQYVIIMMSRELNSYDTYPQLLRG